jgi:protein-tyrosine-phosphatase
MTHPLKVTKLTFSPEWQPKYVDSQGVTQHVSVKTYYRLLTVHATKEQKIDISTMQLYPISEEDDFQCVIAFLHLALGELYQDPNQAKAQMTILCKRMLQMHANLMSMDSVDPAEGSLHSKICGLWRAELKSYGDALSSARQRESHYGAGKMDEPKLPVLTNANVADLQYNLDQRLKDNNVPSSQIFSYCKRVLTMSAENANECHAEILTAVAKTIYKR